MCTFCNFCLMVALDKRSWWSGKPLGIILWGTWISQQNTLWYLSSRWIFCHCVAVGLLSVFHLFSLLSPSCHSIGVWLSQFRVVIVCKWHCQLVEEWRSFLWSSTCLWLLRRRGSPHSSFIILLSVLTVCHKWINFLRLAAVRWGDWARRKKESRGERERAGSERYSQVTHLRTDWRWRPDRHRRAWIYRPLCLCWYNMPTQLFSSLFCEKQLDDINSSGSTQNCPRVILCPAVVWLMSFFKSQHLIMLRERPS